MEAKISKALDDPAATSPIVAKLARLIAGYSANLSLHVVGEPRWPIEAVATRLTREARTDAFNWPESMKPQAIIKRARNPHRRRQKVRAVKGQRDG
jgi:hypothetical protein